MTCPRCKGLMVPVDLYDNQASSEDRWYSTEQCANCSHIHFPHIHRKEVTNGQETSPSPNAHERQGKERLLVDKNRQLKTITSLAFPLLQ